MRRLLFSAAEGGFAFRDLIHQTLCCLWRCSAIYKQADTCITKRAPTTLVIFKLVHLYICTIYCAEHLSAAFAILTLFSAPVIPYTYGTHTGTREKYYGRDNSGDLISAAKSTCYLGVGECDVLNECKTEKRE